MPDQYKLLSQRIRPTWFRKLLAAWIVGAGLFVCLWLPYSKQPYIPALAIWLISSIVIIFIGRNLKQRSQKQEATKQHLLQNLTDLESRLSSENQQLEKKLQESIHSKNAHRHDLREVEQILNDTDAAICFIDNEYTIRRANNALANLFNQEKSRLIGNKCFKVWQTPICGTHQCPLQRIGNGEKRINEENFEIKNADGEKATMTLTVTPFTDAAGNSLGIIKTIRQPDPNDAQQQKKISSQTHDLNNVLTAVIGHTELAIQQTEPGTLANDNLCKSLKAAERGQKLVSQLSPSVPTTSSKTNLLSLTTTLSEVSAQLKKKLPALPDQPATSARKQKRRPIPGGNEKILFVDDEEVLISMTKQFMDELGYQFDGEISSINALERFRESPDYYDLVITDQTMPLLTGIKMAEAMLSIRPNLPVILYTGYSENIDKEQAKTIGIDIFLMKPVAASALAQTIRTLLDNTENSTRAALTP